MTVSDTWAYLQTKGSLNRCYCYLNLIEKLSYAIYIINTEKLIILFGAGDFWNIRTGFAFCNFFGKFGYWMILKNIKRLFVTEFLA